MSPSTRPTHHRPWNYSSSCGDRSCRSSSHMSDSSAAVGTSPTVRRSADERREQIRGIAIEHFAVGGYRATSTNVIAREAGISQPYLFRLFRTKQELFLACDERACQPRFAAYRPMGVRTRRSGAAPPLRAGVNPVGRKWPPPLPLSPRGPPSRSLPDAHGGYGSCHSG